MNIAIWPGSSSFFPGMTPFGFFDNDYQFQCDADKVADFCARRIGFPISDVELQDIHFYTAFEEAVLEYSNQVNQFSIRDNLFLLQGSTVNNNLTGRPINNINSLSTFIALSKNYGTEAGSGGRLVYKTASIDITAGQQVYDIANANFETASDSLKTIEIRKIFHETPPAIVRYFDPFVGTGLGSQQLLENFGWGSYSPGVSFLMMPVYADLLRIQAIEFNDLIRKSGFSFELSGTRLRIFPIPTYDYKLYIQYTTAEDRNNLAIASGSLTEASTQVGDFSNAPYELHQYTYINPAGKQWIYKYALALAKEILGNIRNKYSSIPIPNAEVQLNGADLVSQAQTEKDALISQLRENLDAVSRDSQLTKLATEAESTQNQLSKIPMAIYIG
jgi:hypothetical protein